MDTSSMRERETKKGGNEGSIIHECEAERKNTPDNRNFLLTIAERTSSPKPFQCDNQCRKMLQYHRPSFFQASLQLSESSSSSLPANAYFKSNHFNMVHQQTQDTYTPTERERERERDLANCFCFLQNSSNLQVGIRTMNAGSCHHCRLQVEGLRKQK